MNVIQELPIGDGYFVFMTEYSLVVIRDSKKVFHIASDEKLLAFKVMQIKQPIQSKIVEPYLIFIIDELLSWCIYSINKGKQFGVKSLVEISSSKSLPIFEEFKSISNKQRRGLKCFVNQFEKEGRLSVEVQLSVSLEIWVLECGLRGQKLEFGVRKGVLSGSIMNFVGAKKKVVESFTFGVNRKIPETVSVLKDVVLFDKIVCFEDESGVFEIVSFLVTVMYEYSIGDIKITGMSSKPTGVVLTASELLVTFHEKSMILDLLTHQIRYLEKGGNLIVAHHRTLFKSGDELMEVTTEGDRISFKKIVTDVWRYQYVIPDPSHQNQCYYGVHKNNSLDYIKRINTRFQSSNIIPSNSDRIDKVLHTKDQFSSILEIQKVNRINNEKLETEYFSNQLHLTQLLSYSHDIGGLKGLKIIYLIQRSTIVLTGDSIGSVFLEIQASATSYSVVNSPTFKSFEESEVTLHLSVFQNVIIQVTLSKLVISESNFVTKMELSKLLEIDIEIDHSIRLGNVLILGVHNQLHLFDVRNTKNPTRKFIFCFDHEIQNLGTCNTNNVVTIKFINSNTINIYYVDYEKQTFTLVKQISPQKEITIKDVYTIMVKINAVDHCVSLIRSNLSPICVIVNNEINIKQQQVSIKHYDLKYLSSHLIPVSYDSEKYTFLSSDMYVQFARSVVMQQSRDISVTLSKILNNKPEEVYYANLVNKNLSLRLYETGITIFQQKTGKFVLNQSSKKISILGYKCDVQFTETKLGKGSMRIVGYQKGVIEESEFKGREISKLQSSTCIPGKLPSQICTFALDFKPNKLKQINKGVYILLNDEEIWLVRFTEKQKCMYLSIFGKFQYNNEEFQHMKNRLPVQDYENQDFLNQFNKIYKFKDVQVLKNEEGHYELLILYPQFILILEIRNMIFKIQQILKPEFQIQTILDNFSPSRAYLRTKNTLYLLSKPTSSTYSLTHVEELNDDIVLATQISDWQYSSRSILLSNSSPEQRSTSRLLIKSFGEIEIQRVDLQNGEESTREMYL